MAELPRDVFSSHKTPSPSKQSSKLGACAGAFFQLFDRFHSKRLFPQKLLPAERRQVPKGRMDEKLPVAKDLLIAEENRGGFPKCGSLNMSLKEVTPEKKKKRKKRSPGVVARLMGLESMPSPEPLRATSQWIPEDSNHKASCQPSENDKSKKQRHAGKQRRHSSRKENELQADERQCSSALIRSHSQMLEEPKPMLFWLPVLSPRNSDCSFRSILSPSKSHNKLLSPIKSPMASKRLFEAAVKILEPNMQPSNRAVKNFRIGMRPILNDGNREDEYRKNGNDVQPGAKRKPQTTKKQVPASLFDQGHPKSKPEKKPTVGSDLHAALTRSHPVGITRMLPLPMNQSALEEEPPSGQSSLLPTLHIKDDAKFNNAKQDLRVCRAEKSKIDPRKQENGSRRRSQSNAQNQKFRNGAVIHEKDLGCDNFGNAKLQATQRSVSVSKSTLDPKIKNSTNRGSPSNGSGSILSYSRLFRSNKDIPSCSDGKRDSMVLRSQHKADSSLMRSLLKRRAKMEHPPLSVTHSAEVKEAKCQSNICVSDSENPTVHTMDVIESNKSSVAMQLIAKSSSSDQIIALNSVEEETSSTVIETENSIEALSDLIAANQTLEPYSAQSSCTSCNVLQGDERVDKITDTASSNVLKSKETVSYSGKTTSVILQELLTALNLSKRKFASDEAPDCSLKPAATSCKVKPVIFISEAVEDDDTDDSAISACPLMSKALQDIEVVRDEMPRGTFCCDNELVQASPISTLACPFKDEYSDSWNSIQDQATQTSDYSTTTTISNPVMDSACSAQSERMVIQPNGLGIATFNHNIEISNLNLQSEATHASASEKDYVKVIVGAAKLSPEDVYSARLQLSNSLLHPHLFMKLEEKNQFWDWGIFPSEEDIRSCTSEAEWHLLRSQYAEAALHNRKLVYDCVSEALHLNLGIGEVRLQHYLHPPILLSVSRLSCSICRQLKDWREMICSMNVDDVVEKEMNTDVGKWAYFENEVSEMAVEMEGHILKELVEELVTDLWGRGRKMPT